MDAKVTITKKGLVRLTRSDNDLTEYEVKLLAEIRRITDQGYAATCSNSTLEKLGYIKVEWCLTPFEIGDFWFKDTPKPVYTWDETTGSYIKKIE